MDDSLINLLKNFINPFILGIFTFVGLHLESFIDPINVFFSLIIRSLVVIIIMISYIMLTSEKIKIGEIFSKQS